MTRRTLVRVLGPALVALLVLGGAEAALRAGGFEVKFTAGADPRPNMLPLFKPATRADGVAVWRRGDAPAVEFLQDKPADGLRVFVIGESSVWGFPWGPAYSLTRFLQEQLAAALPGRTVEVVNCGIMGIASWHTRRIVAEEVVRFAPDVVIIYTGHNDWNVAGPEHASAALQALAPLRLFQLAVLANQRFGQWWNGPLDVRRLHAPNQPYGFAHDRARGRQTLTAAERDWIVTRFRDNMRAMIDAARGAGAQVLVAGLAQNLADFPPGTSRHRPGLDDADRARWRAAMAAAERHAAAGDCAQALAELEVAVAIDARPALAHYVRGRCLEQGAAFDAARAAYVTANDRDEVPLGVPSVVNDVLRTLAGEADVPFVDVPAALAARSPHALVGAEYFFDHLHPGVAGQAAIGDVFAEALGVAGAHTDPATVAALASEPDVVRQTHAANVILYMTLGWYDDALAELEAGARTFPDFRKLRPAVEEARAKDTVPARTDFPRAPD